ncbi:hypothetical protein Q1W71_23465 [Flavobacterium pectinovorum]|uniref:hypothetical protein n=1 Tax=Flavobacterium pectinovorum TaxID=29533 RepID=UPI00265F3CA6|nr:hypothetical protein [Flavobacterium pectinovorum]WKL47894.1 hypothetical protein Q1W71_23465 [Flavobacterium pectinovorum]
MTKEAFSEIGRRFFFVFSLSHSFQLILSEVEGTQSISAVTKSKISNLKSKMIIWARQH